MCEIVTNASTDWYSNNNRPIVLLDMDDVITNCLQAVIQAYNEKYGTHFKFKNCTVWNLSEFFGVSVDEVLKLFRADKFFEELTPKRGSIQAIKKMVKSTKYDIYTVTATSDTDGSELVQKINWFKKYIPEFNVKRIISCQDKSIIRGDVIVDDKVKNLDECKPYMQCILMDSPTNQENDTYLRIGSLTELPNILEQMFYNGKGGIRYYEKVTLPKLLNQREEDDDAII